MIITVRVFDRIGAEVRQLSFYVNFETTKSPRDLGYFVGLFSRKTVVKCQWLKMFQDAQICIYLESHGVFL